MKTSEMAELIKGRRSIRSWLDKPVNEDMLLQAIELATWAPNGGNQQNWLFYVILNKKVINSIADAVQTRAEAGPEPADIRTEPVSPQSLESVAAGPYHLFDANSIDGMTARF